MNRHRPGCSVLALVTVAALSSRPASTTAHAQNRAGAAPASELSPQTLPWAYPVAAPGAQREDDGSVRHVPGSTAGYTQVQIDDPYNPPDWFPDDHPPMPMVVAHGRRPAVRGCAHCHLANGNGHPESSSLADLSAVYILQQMNDFKNDVRKNSVIMTAMAGASTEAELADSAAYFSSLKSQPWIRVVEANTVPKTFVGAGNMRFVSKEGGTEPIGQRVIEVPEDAVQAESRNSHSGFVAYVPVGSTKKGEALVTTGGDGKTIRCSICHGPDLKGLAGVPSIAGRSPIYIVRQLADIRSGRRAGVWAELMKGAVSKLTLADMVAIAAYASSQKP